MVLPDIVRLHARVGTTPIDLVITAIATKYTLLWKAFTTIVILQGQKTIGVREDGKRYHAPGGT